MKIFRTHNDIQEVDIQDDIQEKISRTHNDIRAGGTGISRTHKGDFQTKIFRTHAISENHEKISIQGQTSFLDEKTSRAPTVQRTHHSHPWSQSVFRRLLRLFVWMSLRIVPRAAKLRTNIYTWFTGCQARLRGSAANF